MEIENLTPASFTGGNPVTAPKSRTKKTRQRKQLSCVPCHQLKIRCDRGYPCHKCARCGRVDECRYDSSSSQLRKGPLDCEVAREVPRSGLRVGDGDQLPDAMMQEEIDSFENVSSANTNSITSTLTTSPKISQSPDSSHDSPPGYVGYINGKVRFKGPSHWASLTSQFGELTPFLFNVSPAFQHMSARLKKCKQFYKPRTQRNRNFPFLNGSERRISPTISILSILPERNDVVTFVENYLGTFEMTHRLLHIPTFREEFAAFLKDTNQASDAWLAQLMLMLALGCPRARREQDTTIVDNFLDAAEIYLSKTQFMYKPDLTILRVMCMISIAKQIDIVAFDDSDGLWNFMGFIVRLATWIGLHLDPSHFTGMPPLEMEMRKRIWITISMLDVQISIDAGMPILLASPNFECPAPGNFNDEEFASPKEGIMTPHAPNAFTQATYQSLLAQSMPLAVKITNSVNLATGPLDSVVIQNLNNQVRAHLNGALGLLDGPAKKCPYHPWILLQKTIIEIFYRRLLLALHRQQSLSPDSISLHPESYFACLECSYSLIILQRTFHEESNRTDIEWFAEIFKGDFFIAALYVCLGLWQNNLSTNTGGELRLPERETAMMAVRACLDIWSRKISISMDHYKTHLLLSMVIHGLEARENGIDLPIAMEAAAEDTIDAVEKAFMGKEKFTSAE